MTNSRTRDEGKIKGGHKKTESKADFRKGFSIESGRANPSCFDKL